MWADRIVYHQEGRWCIPLGCLGCSEDPKQSDDGTRFSRLLSEIESLPTELTDLFQGILDTLETDHRRIISRTVSLLRFLNTIPEAKTMHLWLNLSDFYFLEDYEADPRFAEITQFPNQGFRDSQGQ